MMKKRLMSGLVVATLFSTLPAQAAPTLQALLNGKPVTAVPVDQIAELTVRFDGGKPLQSLIGNNFNGIHHALELVSSFAPADKTPDIRLGKYKGGEFITSTGAAPGWPKEKQVTAELSSRAINLDLFNVVAGDTLMLGLYYSRLAKTGKTFYKDGVWQDETRWYTIEPLLGKTSLKVGPPSAANQAPANSQLEPLYLKKVNTHAWRFTNAIDGDTTMAEIYAYEIMPKVDQLDAANATSPEALMAQAMGLVQAGVDADAKPSFKGSEVKSIKFTKGPVYNWNRYSGSEWIHAKYEADLEVYLRRQVGLIDNNATYLCKGIAVNARKTLGSGQWEFVIDSISGNLKAACTKK
jgi:hypothetical protein